MAFQKKGSFVEGALLYPEMLGSDGSLQISVHLDRTKMSSGLSATWKTLYNYSDAFSFIAVSISHFKRASLQRSNLLSGLDLAKCVRSLNFFMLSMQKGYIHITGYWQSWQFLKLIDFLAPKIIHLKTVLSEEIWSTCWS